MSLLEVYELSSYYETRKGMNQALENLSFTLNTGEMIALIGESGCGKSTAGFSIMQMIQPPGKIMGGKVILDGTDLTELSESELRKVLWKDIAMIPQSAMNALNPAYKIGDQLVEAIRIHNPHIPKALAKQKAIGLLVSVGVNEKWFDAYPHKLSGGMKQRAIIAMALTCDPKIIISDESTTGLDVLIEAQIMKLLKEIAKERGLGVIIITHDLRLVMAMANKIGIMYAGLLIEEGTLKDICSNPRHPYTKALFESQIKFTELDKEVLSIEGSVPRLIDPEKKCRFIERCSYRMPICEQEVRILFDVSPTHRVACLLEAVNEA